jgi:hypothetical protein
VNDTMGKLNTRLVNETDKILVVYEVTSNGAQARLKELKPKPAAESSDSKKNTAKLVTSTPTGETNVVDKPDFLVQSAVDPNDSYKTLRVWHGKEAVLGVSTDEMIDNIEIIIKYEDGGFTKTPVARDNKRGKVKNKVKEVKKHLVSKFGGEQGDDNPSLSEELSSRPFSSWAIFKPFFKNQKT